MFEIIAGSILAGYLLICCAGVAIGEHIRRNESTPKDDNHENLYSSSNYEDNHFKYFHQDGEWTCHSKDGQESYRLENNTWQRMR